MNESNSEKSVDNWLVNYSSKKKKQSAIINFVDKITTQEQKKVCCTFSLNNSCKRLAVQHGGKSTLENFF